MIFLIEFITTFDDLRLIERSFEYPPPESNFFSSNLQFQFKL